MAAGLKGVSKQDPLRRETVRISYMSPLQKLTTEHTEHAERLRCMNNKDNFWPLGACKIFTTLCSMKDNIIVSLCDLRGLCGEKITFLPRWLNLVSRDEAPPRPSTLSL